ncbi:MAG: ATP-binding protein [Bacilli bacterium]|jgi:hypothetical protein|nr:ATP-binding protein [Bacilli bacterium]
MKDFKEEIDKIVPVSHLAEEETIRMMESFATDEPVAKKLRELKLSRAQVRANLGLIAAYQEDVDYCSRCPGLSACQKDTPFHQSDLILNEGRLERTYGPCPLYLRRETVLSSYVYRDFPDEWLSLVPTSLSNSSRVKAVYRLFAEAVRSKSRPWVYLMGEVGSGRSYLTAAFANGYALRGERVAFMNANVRFDELKGDAVKRRPLFEEKLKGLESIPLLVIDDFGSEFKSDYVRDQIVMPLLSERGKRNLLTVFLSDYSLAEIKELYSTSRGSSIMANRLVGLIESKIAEVGRVEKGVENL